MSTIDLGAAGWRLHELLPGDWTGDDVGARIAGRAGIEATVPGSIQVDLWRAGEIEDPYVGRNSLAMEWVADRTWAYTCSFVADEAWRGRRVRLRFDGIDYAARVLLNGVEVGTHTGMFAPAMFEVDDLLRYGERNDLVVVIAPAPAEQDQFGRTSLVRSGKSRMGYWWDFCPRIVNLGLWDAVSLDVSGQVRIDDIWVRPTVDWAARRAEVPVVVTLHAATPADAVVDVSVTDESGREVTSTSIHVAVSPGVHTVTAVVDIADARLWWPNGSGAQPLYRAHVTVHGATVSDEASVSFGLRDVRLEANVTPDATALPYTLVVNGRRVYLNGWNWVPLDALYGRSQPDKLDDVLELAARAGVNLLRVNGVGLIERRDFYERCDRLGLMVWQEFIVTSSEQDRKPSDDPQYLAAVVAEARRIVPRRRNHPSLALWCAGNELESLAKLPLDDAEPLIAALKAVVAELDPDCLWLPTSPTGRKPFNGLASIRRDPEGLHDVHGPWLYEGLEDQYTLYNAGTSLLHSEFGAEGLTNIETLRALLPEAELTLDRLGSPMWRHLSAWWVRPGLWREWFGPVNDLEHLVEATQMLQAEAVRYAIESNRRRIPRNSGSLPWQFNEPYPMAACTSAIDYHARPKAQYFAVAEAYRPVSVTARYDRLAWGGHERFAADLWVVDASAVPKQGTLHARVISVDGRVLAAARMPYDPGNGTPALLGTIGFAVTDAGGEAFLLDLRLTDAAGEETASNRVCVSPASDLSPLSRVPPTELRVRVIEREASWRLEVDNIGPQTAMFVRISDARAPGAGGQAFFDANHFCLLPTETRTVTVDWRRVDEPDRRLLIKAWNTVAAPVTAVARS